jgi:hypothetical protein
MTIFQDSKFVPFWLLNTGIMQLRRKEQPMTVQLEDKSLVSELQVWFAKDLHFQDHPADLRHMKLSLFRTAENRDYGVMRIELKFNPSVACVVSKILWKAADWDP